IVCLHEIALGYYRLPGNRNNSWLGPDSDNERQSLAAGHWLSCVRSSVWEDRLPPQEVALTTRSRLAALNLQHFCAINRAGQEGNPLHSPAKPRRQCLPMHSHGRTHGLIARRFSPRPTRGFSYPGFCLSSLVYSSREYNVLPQNPN